MSYEIPLFDLTFLSSGDMSSNQFVAVQASTTNAVDGCTVVATRGGQAIGVYQNNSTQSEAGKVRVHGVTKMIAGDSSGMANAITVGAGVVASSKGYAVPSTANGQFLVGIALEGLSTGSTGIISVLLTPGALSTST